MIFVHMGKENAEVIAKKIKYYAKVVRWMWKHREEPNNRAKFRRMMKEVSNADI